MYGFGGLSDGFTSYRNWTDEREDADTVTGHPDHGIKFRLLEYTNIQKIIWGQKVVGGLCGRHSLHSLNLQRSEKMSQEKGCRECAESRFFKPAGVWHCA